MTVNVVAEVVVGGRLDEEQRAVGLWLCCPRPNALPDGDAPDDQLDTLQYP